MSRLVRLVLVDGRGAVLGMLPEFPVGTPWWPDVEPVVRLARDRYGVEVSVLRLIDSDRDGSAKGGHVTYLAEVLGQPPAGLLPAGGADGAAVDHPLRAPWARPGGLAVTVAWADQALARAGRRRTGPPAQVKSWNLSCILRLPTDDGPVWCKSVPPFLAHEGTVIALVAASDPDAVPPVIGADPASGTVLLADVPGEDQWDAPADRLITMVEALVRIQGHCAGGVERLAAAGGWDWRSDRLPSLAEELLRSTAASAGLSAAELSALRALVTDLPRRFAELGACGLPDTLVHGDFHPGNWRYDGRNLRLMDWGDSGVGHPLFDMAAFLPRVAGPDRGLVRAAWMRAWRRAAPGCEPDRAARLIAPVAALRQAVLYARFLAGIEPDEHRYHEQDVPQWLRESVRAATSGGRDGQAR